MAIICVSVSVSGKDKNICRHDMITAETIKHEKPLAAYHKALELIGRLLSFFAGCKVNEINTFLTWILKFDIKLRAIFIYMVHWALSNNFGRFL